MNNNSDLHSISNELMEILKDSKPAGALKWERRVEDFVADFDNVLSGKRNCGSIELRIEKNFGTEARILVNHIQKEKEKNFYADHKDVVTFKVEFSNCATIRDTENFLTQIKTMNEALELGCLLVSTLSGRSL